MKERISPQCPNGHGPMRQVMRNDQPAIYGLPEHVMDGEKVVRANRLFATSLWLCPECDSVQLTDHPV